MVPSELASSNGFEPHGVWTMVPSDNGTRAAMAAMSVSVSRARNRDENQMQSSSPVAAVSATRSSSVDVS
jgi:hypothetical protein